MTKANLGITVNSCFSRLCRLCGVFSAVILLSTIVQAAPPTVSITGPTSGQIFVAPATITLSATASDPDAGGSVTKVEFFRGGSTLIGQATRVGTTNNYTFTWANVAAGTYALTAKATDNTNATATTAAVNITVNDPDDDDGALVALFGLIGKNQPPTISLSANCLPTACGANTTKIVLSSTASDPDVATLPGGQIKLIELFEGSATGTPIKTCADTTICTFDYVPASLRTYNFYAIATDGWGKKSAVGVPTTITVANQLPTVTWIQPTPNQSFTVGSTIPLVANAADSDGTVSKVEFFRGGTTLIGQAQLINGRYEYNNWVNPAAGSYSLTARVTDNSNAQVTSAAITITVVANQPPMVSWGGGAAPTTAVTAATNTLTANATDTSGTISAATFLINGQAFGATSLGQGGYKYDWVPAGDGVYRIVFRATDNQGASTEVSTTVVATTTPDAGTPTVPATVAVGTIPATFGVSQSGAATYTVPIKVPPGVNGLQPSLALTYSSQGGNGILGVGWALTGLSTIHHCPETIDQDGVKRGVNYDNSATNDKFCLDGQRLIQTTETEDYNQTCAGGTSDIKVPVFRTETESYLKVVQYPACPEHLTGPLRWRVTTKSGQIMEYGSRFNIVSNGYAQRKEQGLVLSSGELRSNAAKLWALDVIKDRAGNRIEIDYAGPQVCGGAGCGTLTANSANVPIGSFPPVEYYPTQIRYGSSSEFLASVGFVYGGDSGAPPECTDQEAQYFYDSGAGQNRLKKLLCQIKTNADGSAVRTYKLAYEQSVSSSQKRLTSIEECESSGICVPTTTFAWQDYTPSLGTIATGVPDSMPGVSVPGVVPGGPFSSPDGYDRSIQVADINGDGRSDIVQLIVDPSCTLVSGAQVCSSVTQFKFIYTLSTGTGFGTPQERRLNIPAGSYTFTAYVSEWLVADLKGNGQPGVMIADTSNTLSRRFFVVPDVSALAAGAAGNDCVAGNANAACQIWSVATATDISGNTRTNQYRGGDPQFRADVDGDGRIDIVQYQGEGNWFVCLSTGSGFNCIHRNATPPLNPLAASLPSDPDCTGGGGAPVIAYDNQCGSTAQHETLLVDVNGDGKADLVVRRKGVALTETNNPNDYWRVCFSDFGTGTTNSFQCNNGFVRGVKGGIHQIQVFDFNGDGLADMAGRAKEVDTTDGRATVDNNRWKICLSAGDGAFNRRNPGDEIAVTTDTPRCSYWTGPDVNIEDAVFGDFNGDGRTDIAGKESSGTFKVCLSTGVGFSCSTSWPTFVPAEGGKKTIVGDFNGDGRSDVLVYQGGGWRLGLSRGSAPDLIWQIKNGFGATVTIGYASLADASAAVYTKGAGNAVAGAFDVVSPMYVVKQISSSDGIGGSFVNTYTYGGLRGRTDGRGLLGFAEVTKREQAQGNAWIVTRSTYRQDWPFVGSMHKSEKYLDKGGVITTLNRVENYDSTGATYWTDLGSVASSKIRRPHLTKSVSRTFELGSEAESTRALPTVTSETPANQVDEFGNVLSSTVSTSDGYTKITTSTYNTSDKTNWLVGQMLTSEVKHQLTGSPDIVRKTSFSYCAAMTGCVLGAVKEEIIEPVADTGATTSYGNQYLKTAYTYDTYGNREATTVTFCPRDVPLEGACLAADLESRTSTVIYGQGGRFPAITRNALYASDLRHQATHTYNAKFGAIATSTDANQIKATTNYDGFGRKISEKVEKSGSMLAWTTTTYASRTGGGYQVTTDSHTGAQSRTVFDVLERPIEQWTKNFAGSLVKVGSSAYDTLGRKTSAVAAVASTGGSSVDRTTTWAFDELNRVVLEMRPDGGQTRSAYCVSTNLAKQKTLLCNRTDCALTAAEQTTFTCASDTPVLGFQQTIKLTNSQGKTTKVIDANQKNTNYAYDAVSNLVKITGPTGLQHSIAYDANGRRKASLTEPNTGTTTFHYNGAGELRRQAQSNNTDQRMFYDALGRMKQRLAYGNNSIQFSTTWTFDCTNAVGKTCGNSHTAGGKTTSYDQYSRPWRTEERIADPRTFYYHQLYDAKGRVSYIGYPQLGLDKPAFGVRHVYNSSGYQTAVVDAGSGGNFWSISDPTGRYNDGQIYKQNIGNAAETRGYDTLGRIASKSTGQGTIVVQESQYGFDRVGNLTSRVQCVMPTTASNCVGGVSSNEPYTYDLLNRVTTSPGGSYTYDDAGNLQVGPEVGALTYTDANSVSTGYQARKSSIVGDIDYDAAGNVIKFGTYNLEYMAWNMPHTYKQGTQVILAITHNGENQRLSKVGYVNGTPTNETLYIGGTQFGELRNGANWRYYINSPEGLLAIRTQDAVTGAVAEDDRYVHTDHLGSIIAEVNWAAAKLSGYNFAAWGARTPHAGNVVSETRGFTGHEMLDESGLGLVHMNGRLYHPKLGRMLQADPVIQDIYNPQNLNLYSYVMNNPLSMTDPTGFSWWTKWRRPLLSFVAMMAMPGIINAAYGYSFGGVTAEMAAVEGISSFEMASAVGQASLGTAPSFVGAGFAAGGIQGGNIESAVQGAIFAGLNFGIGEITGHRPAFNTGEYYANVALHSALGCAQASSAGGNCRAGALSSAFSAGAGPATDKLGFYGGLGATMGIGAASSRLGGGSAGFGAFQAAMGYLYNRWGDGEVVNDTTGRVTSCGSVVCVPEMEWANSYGTASGDKWTMYALAGLTGTAAAGAALPTAAVGFEAVMLRLAAANLLRPAIMAEAPEFAMLGRYASGLRSSWDKAFVRHEATEFLLSFTRASQPTLHRWALILGGVTTGPLQQYFLYHPTVIRMFPMSFNPASRALAGAPL